MPFCVSSPRLLSTTQFVTFIFFKEALHFSVFIAVILLSLMIHSVISAGKVILVVCLFPFILKIFKLLRV